MSAEYNIFRKKRNWFLDPRTKIFIIFIISTIAMTGDIEGIKTYARLIILLLPCFLLFINNHEIKALIAASIITLSWLSETQIVLYNHKELELIVILVSGITTRFIPPIIMGYFITQSTQVEELVYSLEKMKVPSQITIPIAVMFRFFPTAYEESSDIRDAMKMRGVNCNYLVKHPFSYIEYRYIPLISSIIKIADELSISSITRGLGNNIKRSSIVDVKFQYSDAIMFTVVIIATVLYYVLQGG